MIKKLFSTNDGKNHFVTFLLVCSLFLLWGLGHGMIDVFDKHFQDSLKVSKAESAFVPGVWYSAYFFMALPSGWIAQRFGYKGGILAGLVTVIIGSLLFWPVTKIEASNSVVFAAFLGALFIVATGLAFLETVANPYATVLGRPEHSVVRINMAQTCNGLGWILGPYLAGTFVMSKTEVVNTSNASLYMPYLVIAAVVTVMAVVFSRSEVPDLHAPEETKSPTSPRQHARSIFQEKHFTLGIVSQFFYVAAQTGIFSFFINYMRDYTPPLPGWLADMLPENMKYFQGYWHFTEYATTVLLSCAFVCFFLGRLTGSILLRFCTPHLLLGTYALINAGMMVLVFLAHGWISIVALYASFFFMSIMYPTHFALAIRGLGEHTKLGASCLVMAIVGGSIMPIAMGHLGDAYSMRVGFLVPMICFMVIMLYGFFWRRFFAEDMTPVG